MIATLHTTLVAGATLFVVLLVLVVLRLVFHPLWLGLPHLLLRLLPCWSLVSSLRWLENLVRLKARLGSWLRETLVVAGLWHGELCGLRVRNKLFCLVKARIELSGSSRSCWEAATACQATWVESLTLSFHSLNWLL